MAMSGVNSDHLQREEQGPHHAKLRIMTSNISQETGECHTTLGQAFIWSQTPPPLLTGSKLEVTFSKQTVNAVHQMVLGCIGTCVATDRYVRSPVPTQRTPR